MRSGTLRILGGIGALAGAVAATLVGGALVWERRTHARVAALLARIEDPGLSDIDPVTVPEPVARYLEHALSPGAGTITWARLSQRGQFRASVEPERWAPFSAVQVFRAEPPGFVWDAAIRMTPVVPVRVRDAYGEGHAEMRAKLGGLFTVVDAADEPALLRSALIRFLAESVWIPTRLRPGPHLQWRAEAADTAVATLTDGDVSVSLRFRFDAQGDVVEIFSADRPREVDGGYVEQPWIVRLSEHEWVDGFRIPRRGEVAWLPPTGEEPYWRGRVESLHFETVPSWRPHATLESTP
ncbi:MAG: DUF6544 family protein [Gemmatimonadota bacterium]